MARSVTSVSLAQRGRPVSGLERVWLAAGRISPPYAPAWVVEGEGPLDVPAWTAAWRTVVEAHPLLEARLSGRGRGLRWVPGGPTARVDVVQAGWDGWDGRGAPWLTPRMRPGRDPLVRAVLMPAQGRYAVVAHHALLDGRAVQALAERWAAQVRGERREPAPMGPSEAELAAAAGVSPTREPDADRPSPVPVRGRNGRVRWARRRGPVPQHPLAEIARRLVDHAGQTLRVSVPVDLRPPGPVALRNLTGILKLELVAGESTTAIRNRLRKRVEAQEALGHALAAEAVAGVPLWLMSLVGGSGARRNLRRQRWAASAVISNLGRVGPQRFTGAGFVAKRAFMVPPGHPGVPVFITLAGGPDGLEIAAAGPRAVADGGRLEALLESLAAAP